MAIPLQNKVFIVTGSASGMGLATAQVLLARGASLALCDMNQAGLEKFTSPLSSEQKTHVLTETVDISNRNAVSSFISSAKSHFGKIDGIASIAGTGGHKLGKENVWETSDEEYEYIIDVNVRGLFHILGESLKPGVLEEPGSIVHITSMFSERGYRKGAVFCASKHAAVGMIKSAAIEVGNRGIRVNAVLPGAVDTPMMHAVQDSGVDNPAPNTPMLRLGQPMEVANVVAFLLGDEAGFVTGSTWRVDGGANS